MRITHTALTGEDVDLRKGSSVLGPDATLTRCRVRLPAAKWLTVSGATLIDCRVEGSITNFQGWCRTALTRCTFSGRYRGNDFGRWPAVGGELGGVSSCDFSRAELDGCRFMQVSRDDVVLPGWPFFAIDDPGRRVADLRTWRWPGRLALWIETFADFPPEASFAVFDATTLSPKFGTSPEELHSVLDDREATSIAESPPSGGGDRSRA